jgi:hypothetical protein
MGKTCTRAKCGHAQYGFGPKEGHFHGKGPCKKCNHCSSFQSKAIAAPKKNVRSESTA